MRTFKFRLGDSKEVSYSEEQLKNREYVFHIADGKAFYRVHRILRGGDDPIVSLHKVPNHPANPDDYGEPEKLVRVSELVRQQEFEKAWAELLKRQDAEG